MPKQVAKGRMSIQQQVAAKLGTRNSKPTGMDPTARAAFTKKAPATVTLKRGNTGK